MFGVNEVPAFYKGRELPMGYFESEEQEGAVIHNNVDYARFLNYLRKNKKSAMDVTWDEMKEFLINPEIENVWW